MHDFRFFLEQKPWAGSERLHGSFRNFLTQNDRSGGTSIITGLQVETVKEMEFNDKAMIEGQFGLKTASEFLQAMLDCAWENGLRPTNYQHKDKDGEIAALRDHLGDLRLVALKGLAPVHPLLSDVPPARR